MTNPDGSAGETSPSGSDFTPSEPLSSGYEAPSIEQSQNQPYLGAAQPTDPGYGPPPGQPAFDYPDYPSPAAAPLPPFPVDSGYPSASGFPPPPPPGYGAAPGYPPPYPQMPYQPYQPRQTSGMAIASLVCSAAGLLCWLPALVGLVLGIMAMRETKQSGKDGYGLAVGGAALGGVITVGGVLWILFLVIMAVAGS